MKKSLFLLIVCALVFSLFAFGCGEVQEEKISGEYFSDRNMRAKITLSDSREYGGTLETIYLSDENRRTDSFNVRDDLIYISYFGTERVVGIILSANKIVLCDFWGGDFDSPYEGVVLNDNYFNGIIIKDRAKYVFNSDGTFECWYDGDYSEYISYKGSYTRDGAVIYASGKSENFTFNDVFVVIKGLVYEGVVLEKL